MFFFPLVTIAWPTCLYIAKHKNIRFSSVIGDFGVVAQQEFFSQKVLRSLRFGSLTHRIVMCAARSKAFRAIILGAPASGKGTISSRIVRDFKLKHLSSGDLLRSQMSAKTDVGLMAKEFMNKGSLVPDDVMSTLIINELALLKQHSWLLDGFPRTLKQAETLHQQEHTDVVISLDVPEDEIVQRVAGRWTHISSGRVYNTEFNPPKVPGIDDVTGEKLIQRDDDKPEAVRKRLQTYEANIKPILDYYHHHGVLQLFKGRFTNEIWPKVHEFLSEKIPPKAN